jgi:hypothetical protein
MKILLSKTLPWFSIEVSNQYSPYKIEVTEAKKHPPKSSHRETRKSLENQIPLLQKSLSWNMVVTNDAPHVLHLSPPEIFHGIYSHALEGRVAILLALSNNMAKASADMSKIIGGFRSTERNPTFPHFRASSRASWQHIVGGGDLVDLVSKVTSSLPISTVLIVAVSLARWHRLLASLAVDVGVVGVAADADSFWSSVLRPILPRVGVASIQCQHEPMIIIFGGCDLGFVDLSTASSLCRWPNRIVALMTIHPRSTMTGWLQQWREAATRPHRRPVKDKEDHGPLGTAFSLTIKGVWLLDQQIRCPFLHKRKFRQNC